MCGCLNKTSSSKNTTTVSKTSNATVTITRKSATTSTTNLKESSESVCGYKYHEVRRLKYKIILLKKKYQDKMLDEAYDTVVSWLDNLNINCPDNYEYNVLSQFINEYTEYNT